MTDTERECGEPCDPDVGCEQCAGYWSLMERAGARSWTKAERADAGKDPLDHYTKQAREAYENLKKQNKAMREALEEAKVRLEGIEIAASQGVSAKAFSREDADGFFAETVPALRKIIDALSTDVGKGWVPPEVYTQDVSNWKERYKQALTERDQARAEAAAAVAIMYDELKGDCWCYHVEGHSDICQRKQAATNGTAAKAMLEELSTQRALMADFAEYEKRTEDELKQLRFDSNVTIPELQAENEALRAVRDAAELHRESVAKAQSGIMVAHYPTWAALCAALDAARNLQLYL